MSAQWRARPAALLLAATLAACGGSPPPNSAATATPATAAAVQETAGELLVSGLPAGWVPVHHSELDGLKISEFAPPADSGLDELVRIELAALGGEADPLRFLEARADDLEDACRDSRSTHVWSGLENGNPTALRLFLCPDNRETRRGHVTLMKVVSGAEGVYVIGRTRLTAPFREAPADGALPVSQEEIAGWAAWMRQVRVLPPAD